MSEIKVFNKLVRDKIVDQIKDGGREVEFKILNKEEYLVELKRKLAEEFKEFNEAKTVNEEKEELADLLEVLYALKYAISSHPGEVSKIQKKKRFEKGSFKKKIFLVKAKTS
jgi:predicted house-cleaning noncanonical NTP pyrophosphatase (MazG superfamily)